MHVIQPVRGGGPPRTAAFSTEVLPRHDDRITILNTDVDGYVKHVRHTYRRTVYANGAPASTVPESVEIELWVADD